MKVIAYREKDLSGSSDYPLALIYNLDSGEAKMIHNKEDIQSLLNPNDIYIHFYHEFYGQLKVINYWTENNLQAIVKMGWEVFDKNPMNKLLLSRKVRIAQNKTNPNDQREIWYKLEATVDAYNLVLNYFSFEIFYGYIAINPVADYDAPSPHQIEDWATLLHEVNEQFIDDVTGDADLLKTQNKIHSAFEFRKVTARKIIGRIPQLILLLFENNEEVSVYYSTTRTVKNDLNFEHQFYFVNQDKAYQLTYGMDVY